MIYLEAVMSMNMILILVQVVLAVVSFGYLIFLYFEFYKPKPDKSEGIVKDESGHIISIDGIPFDEYTDRL